MQILKQKGGVRRRVSERVKGERGARVSGSWGEGCKRVSGRTRRRVSARG